MSENLDQTVKTSTDSLKSYADLPVRFENLKIIGQGGMGIVFRAHDSQLIRDVAIKLLLFEGAKDEELHERFAREARVLASLNHSNIVRILSWGVNERGNPYQVMELLEGTTLSGEIGDGKRLSPARFQAIFSGVLCGLSHAHSQGIVHRDIKPSNIILCNIGNEFCPKIVDFGIARLQTPDSSGEKKLTQTGYLLGSPVYMSPEQCKGTVIDPLSDVYSIGCVMYEALTGYPPHRGESAMEIMYKHMTEKPGSLGALASGQASKRLGGLIDRCLEKDSRSRPPASDVLAELNKIFESTLDTRALFAPEKGKIALRYSPVAVAATCLFVLGIGCLIFVSVSGKQTKSAMFMEGQSDPSSWTIDELNRQVHKWKARYEKTHSKAEKAQAALLVLQHTTDLVQVLIRERQYSQAIKQMTAALPYCDHAEDSDGWRAEIYLNIGACHLSLSKPQEAEKSLAAGLAALPRFADGTLHTIHHGALALQLAGKLAVMEVENYRFAEAGRNITLIILSEYHPKAIEKRHGAIAEGPHHIYEIAQVLSRVSLRKPEESIGALKLFNQLGEYLLNQGAEEAESAGTRNVMLQIAELAGRIPHNTPELRKLSSESYRLLAIYEEDTQKHADAAKKYKRLADSLK